MGGGLGKLAVRVNTKEDLFCLEAEIRVYINMYMNDSNFMCTHLNKRK